MKIPVPNGRRWGYHVVMAAGMLGVLWLSSYAQTQDFIIIRTATLKFIFGGLIIGGKLLGSLIRNGGRKGPDD